VTINYGVEGDGVFPIPNFTVKAGRNGWISLASVGNTSGSGGIGNISLSGSHLNLGGTVTAQGNITFQTDSIDLGGTVSGPGSDVGILTISPNTSGNSILVGDAGEGGPGEGVLHLDSAALDLLSPGFAAIHIGDVSTDAVTIEESIFQDPVQFTGSKFYVNGTLTGQDNASLSFIHSSGSPFTTHLAANLITHGNAIYIDDSVVLSNHVLLDTTAGGTLTTGANVTVTHGIDGFEGVKDLSINAGTSGSIDLKEAIGSDDLIGNLNFQSKDLTLGGTVRSQGNIDFNSESLVTALDETIQAQGNISFVTDSIMLRGELSSSGDLLIAPRTTSRSIGIGSPTGDLNLSVDEIALLQDGFNSITIGNNAGSGAITVEAITFTDPVRLVSPTGSITLNGQLTGADNATVAIVGNGAGSNATTLNAPIVTSGKAVDIQDNVILGLTRIDTTNGVSGQPGASITINGTVNADANGRDFILNAGTEGTIHVTGAIGASERVQNVDFRSAQLTVGSTVAARGNLSFLTDEIALNGSITGDPGGTSRLLIAPQTTSGSFGIGNGAAGTLQISTAELAYLTDGFFDLTFGNSSTGELTLTATTSWTQSPSLAPPSR